MNLDITKDENKKHMLERPKHVLNYILYVFIFVVLLLIVWLGIKLLPSAILSIVYPVHSHYATTASMNQVTLVVAPIQIEQSKTPESDEAKENLNLAHLNVPLAYLQYVENWEGGYQTFVSIFYNYETLKPTALEEKNPRAVDDLHGLAKLTSRVINQTDYLSIVQNIKSTWRKEPSELNDFYKFISPRFINKSGKLAEPALIVTNYVLKDADLSGHLYVTCYPGSPSCSMFDDSNRSLALEATIPRSRLSEWRSIRHGIQQLLKDLSVKH